MPSLHSFWERLGGKASGVSYEAVRTYHYDREPPISYIAQVVKTFPRWRLEWLVGISDVPTLAHAQSNAISDATVDAMQAAPAAKPEATAEGKAAGDARYLQYTILSALGVPHEGGEDPLNWHFQRTQLRHWLATAAELRLRMFMQTIGFDPSTFASLRETLRPATSYNDRYALMIGRALRGPLEAFGIDPQTSDVDGIGDYVAAALPALFLLLPAYAARERERWDALGRHPVDAEQLTPRIAEVESVESKRATVKDRQPRHGRKRKARSGKHS